MVNRRGMGQPRTRNRRQIRTQLRQIRRTLTLEPRRVNCSPDPPPVNHSFVHSNIIPIILKYDKDAKTNSFSAGSGNSDPTITFGLPATKTFLPFDLSYGNIYAAWVHWTGHATSQTAFHHADLCVKKVSYWGPSATELTPVAIGLTVDIPAPSSSASVTDLGTTTARARCALSLPCSWQAGASELKIVRIDCDNEGTLLQAKRLAKLEEFPSLGILHVSLNVRVTKAT